MIDRLKKTVHETWSQVLANSSAAALVKSMDFDMRFYQIYLLETYHYTLHNARNQALVAVRLDNKDIHYMKFCLKHAMEEVGHELMALHDLRKTGVTCETHLLPAPLPETQNLISYLYWISQNGNPLQRLGYSFWAEDSYEYFAPFLANLQQKLNLQKSQMSFFVEHAGVDESHAEQVQRAITEGTKTEKDYQDIEAAAVNSLKLASSILDGVTREYLKLKKGEASRYDLF